MCGLYGSIRFAPEQRRLDVIAHRGPDGSGWMEFSSRSGPVALGHRRLAIIDTSDAGLQPMADPLGRHFLIFNGEIYNYLELRRELEEKGHSFVSNSDSEVLLTAFREWGEGCLNRLLGMFAFAVWDEREKRLFAARDRFGIKPLYYVTSSQGFAFASEIKQLLGLPGLSGRMNLPRVHDFLGSGILDHTGETLFEGIRQLPPGFCLSIDASGVWSDDVPLRRWYQIPAHSTLNVSENEAAERFRELLSDSIRMHLRSDVPVGSCLSGGLDSSSIVCLMKHQFEQLGQDAAVHAISACYDEKSVDERPFMEAVVSSTGALPHYVFPRADDVFARADDMTWHQDEPVGSTSVFAQWCVFEEARRLGIKVMLDGQGADEQLAGYHSSYSFYMADLVRKARYLMVLRTMLERRQVHGVALREQAKRFIATLLPENVRGGLIRQREALYNHDWMASEAFRSLDRGASILELASRTHGLPAATDIATLCVVMTFASNLQMLLHWEDRSSMAHSIESRVPFLDHRLVEFTLALGNDHKIVGADTKRVLRQAMKGILPEAVRQRRDKLGFATPEQVWFRGPLRREAYEGVEATLKQFPGLLNTKGTRELAADMLEGRRNLDFTLWRIINLGIWGRRLGVTM